MRDTNLGDRAVSYVERGHEGEQFGRLGEPCADRFCVRECCEIVMQRHIAVCAVNHGIPRIVAENEG